MCCPPDGADHAARTGRRGRRRRSSSTATAAASGGDTSSTPPGSTPAFTLTGCATSQSEVALTLQRLRLMDGASEVHCRAPPRPATPQRRAARAGRAARAATRASRCRSPLPACPRDHCLADSGSTTTAGGAAPPAPVATTREIGGADDLPRSADADGNRCACRPLGAWFTRSRPSANAQRSWTPKCEAARQQLASAESQADSASQRRDQYSAAYASLVSLGQAVPVDRRNARSDLHARPGTHSRDVQFTSITAGTSGRPAHRPERHRCRRPRNARRFTQMPFTFVFNGSFVDLYKLLNQLEGFTVQTPGGTLHVNGRLLTIDRRQPGPRKQPPRSPARAKPKRTELTGTITRTAYVCPPARPRLPARLPPGRPGRGGFEHPPADSAGAPAPAVVKATP